MSSATAATWNIPPGGRWREARDASPRTLTRWIAHPQHDTGQRFEPEFLVKALESEQRHVFDIYIDTWLRETAWYSSISSITRHPNFAEVISFGDLAIKFILQRLDGGEVRIHWFPVLKHLTHTDPVPPDERGVVNRMAQRWLDWGRIQGYLH